MHNCTKCMIGLDLRNDARGLISYLPPSRNVPDKQTVRYSKSGPSGRNRNRIDSILGHHFRWAFWKGQNLANLRFGKCAR